MTKRITVSDADISSITLGVWRAGDGGPLEAILASPAQKAAARVTAEFEELEQEYSDSDTETFLRMDEWEEEDQ